MTPMVNETAAASSGASEARKGKRSESRKTAPETQTMAPTTAIPVIEPMDRNNGRIERKSVSAPAVKAINEMAIPLNSSSRTTISFETSPRAYGPTTMPAIKYPVSRGSLRSRKMLPARKAISSKKPPARATPLV